LPRGSFPAPAGISALRTPRWSIVKATLAAENDVATLGERVVGQGVGGADVAAVAHQPALHLGRFVRSEDLLPTVGEDNEVFAPGLMFAHEVGAGGVGVELPVGFA
jgi:hypothetical protein